MRLVLQNGPLSQGRVWFDDLRLRQSQVVDPVNLLVNGDFERRNDQRLPEAIRVSGGQIGIDLTKANSGYSSLLLKAAAAGESGFSFLPVAAADFKYDREFTCSFFYQSDSQQKGTIIAEMLDENGVVLARRLAQIDIEAVPGSWKANSFAFKFNPQGEEVARVKSLQIRVATSMSADASMWFDTFIMR